MDYHVENVKKAYANIAEDFEKKVKSEDLDHVYIEKFLSLFEPGKKILDVGAGTGTLAEHMNVEHKLKVTAIDLSKEMVNLAKKNYPDLKIIQMDLRKLDFPKTYFDGVFCMYSIIHIPEENILLSLNEINRVLKKGGFLYLALQEPVNKTQKDGYYPVVYKKGLKMFINLFTEAEITRHLSKCGFKVLSSYRRAHKKGMEFPFNKLLIIAKKK